jgi:hypothetical protein
LLYGFAAGVPVERGSRDPQRLADSLDALAGIVSERLRDLCLLRIEHLRPSTLPPPRPGRLQPRLRPLSNQRPLELRQRRKEMKHKLAAAGGRVYALRHARKPHAHGFQPLDDLDEMLQRPPQPIQPPDHQRVAVSQDFHELQQLRPLALGSALFLFVDPLAASGFQRIFLERQVLVVGRNARVAYLHASIVPEVSKEQSLETLKK